MGIDHSFLGHNDFLYVVQFAIVRAHASIESAIQIKIISYNSIKNLSHIIYNCIAFVKENMLN